MAWQKLGVFLVAVLSNSCLCHLLNAAQTAIPEKDILMSVEKQSVKFECPNIPKCPDLQCPDLHCQDLQCPKRPIHPQLKPHKETPCHVFANPSTIRPGMSKELTVNCTLSDWKSSGLVKVISLSLAANDVNSREDPVDLASVSVLASGGKPKLFQSSKNVSVSGEISEDDVAFLSLTWHSPLSDTVREYVCTVYGLGDTHRMVMLEDSVVVTAEMPTTNDLLEHVLKMQQQADVGEKKIDKIQSSVDDLAQSFAKSLAERHDELMNKITVLQDSASKLHEMVGELKDQNDKATEGFVDLMNTGRREWKLAFRATANVGKSVYKAYMTGAGISGDVEPGCKQVEASLPCHGHYRNNAILEDWENFLITEVAVVLYDNYTIVTMITFDGRGTDMTSWFQKSKVKTSPWTDLKGASVNYFSIKGPHEARRFFINRSYGGCSKDVGWFVVADADLSRECPWNKLDTIPKFRYSKSSTSQHWTTGKIGTADVMAVFVKFARTSG